MRTSVFFLVIVFLINFIATALKWYRYFLVDILLHFFGGFFAAMFFRYFFADFILNFSSEKDESKLLKYVLMIVGSVALLGILWELFEYVATSFAGRFLLDHYGIVCCIGNFADTLKDLAIDITGALTYIVLARIRTQSRIQDRLTP